MNFSKAVRAFEGHLIGTKKATHTIACYRSDLVTFREFLRSLSSGKPEPALSDLTERDLARYSDWLKAKGFLSNSRRRKLLTIRKMFAFFYKRKKLHLDLEGLAAPHKIERIPQSIDVGALRRAALGIRGDSAASLRTRVILLILCETGCLASELPLISANSVTPTGLKIDGKRPRELAISSELRESIADLRALLKRGPLLSGFNRFGPLPGSLTPRGLEVLLEGLSKAPSFRAVLGALSHLTPRLIRHSVTIAWLRAGIDRAEVQKRLGLTTPYAFRVYEPMFRNDSNP